MSMEKMEDENEKSKIEKKEKKIYENESKVKENDIAEVYVCMHDRKSVRNA